MERKKRKEKQGKDKKKESQVRQGKEKKRNERKVNKRKKEQYSSLSVLLPSIPATTSCWALSTILVYLFCLVKIIASDLDGDRHRRCASAQYMMVSIAS